MSDYVPRNTPGAAITSQASAAITGGRLVAVSGVGTVAAAAADSNKVVGVAAFDVAASGDKVTVFPVNGGVHRRTASGAITAGDGVVADTGGKIKTAPTSLATAAAAGTLIGRALTTASADGDVIDVVTGIGG